MTIKIIGYNNKKGLKLRNNVVNVVNSIPSKVTIKFEENNNSEPILYIDDILVCKGKVISEKRLLKYLKKRYKDIPPML